MQIDMRLLAVVAVMVGVESAMAQGTPPTVPGPTPLPTLVVPAKSVAVARTIALLPGAGHVYAGNPKRGLAFLGGMAGTLALGGALLGGECLFGHTSDSDSGAGAPSCDRQIRIQAVTAVAFFGTYGWSIYDAGAAARRANRLRTSAASAFVAPTFVSHDDGARRLAFKVGVSLTPR